MSVVESTGLPGSAGNPPIGGYTHWWDADDLSSMVLVGDDVVDTWADKGSGANDATSPSIGRSPRVGRHISLFANRTVLFFVGPATSQGSVLSSSATASSRTQTLFVAAMCEETANNPTLIGCNADGGNRFKILGSNNGLTTDKADVVQLANQANATLTEGTPFVGVQVLTATDITHYLNETSETDADSTAFTGGTTVQIGNSTSIGTGNASFNGVIGEVLIYASTLNATDILTTVDYLQAKWGIS